MSLHCKRQKRPWINDVIRRAWLADLTVKLCGTKASCRPPSSPCVRLFQEPLRFCACRWAYGSCATRLCLNGDKANTVWQNNGRVTEVKEALLIPGCIISQVKSSVRYVSFPSQFQQASPPGRTQNGRPNHLSIYRSTDPLNFNTPWAPKTWNTSWLFLRISVKNQTTQMGPASRSRNLQVSWVTAQSNWEQLFLLLCSSFGTAQLSSQHGPEINFIN